MTTTAELLSELWNSWCSSHRYLDGEEKGFLQTAVVSLELAPQPNSSTIEMVRVKVQQQTTPKCQVGSRAGAIGKKSSVASKAADNNKSVGKGKESSIPTCNRCGISQWMWDIYI